MQRPSSRPDTPDALEDFAVHLAHAAGAEITASLSRVLSVAYKTQGRRGSAPRDPVSDADRAIESMIRTRLAETFPRHGILGEEIDAPPDPSVERVWVLDPIDGTQNFINGFPLFAASIGVLERGRPIAGAIWCSTSHELRPGVYHACDGGPLCFEGSRLRPGVPNPGVLRRVAGEPVGIASRNAPYDVRVTGSAALECAFVAAGLLASTRLRSPRIWDVAAGVRLVQSAGGRAFVHTGRAGSDGAWRPFDRFAAPASSAARASRTARKGAAKGRASGIRDWRGTLLLGSAGAVEALRGIDVARAGADSG